MLISDVKKVVMAGSGASSCFMGDTIMNNLWAINVKKCRWWPKGKYNGKPIQGVKVSLVFHVLSWHPLPEVAWNFGLSYFMWLCFTVRLELEYKLS